jgi:hypothetical protein
LIGCFKESNAAQRRTLTDPLSSLASQGVASSPAREVGRQIDLELATFYYRPLAGASDPQQKELPTVRITTGSQVEANSGLE